MSITNYPRAERPSDNKDFCGICGARTFRNVGNFTSTEATASHLHAPSKLSISILDEIKGFNMSFRDLGLSEWLHKQATSMGMIHPTPVQTNVVPPVLAGRDVIACSKTGSGKTAAFALPIIQRLCEDPYGIFALVLAPTRELAFQIADQFRSLGRPIGLKDCVIVGGMPMVPQGNQLNDKPHVVIATPGRLADHIRSCSTTLALKRLRFLVLDEADRLLVKNFEEDLKIIFDAIKPATVTAGKESGIRRRQTLMFSATLSDAIERVGQLSTADEPSFIWREPTVNNVATVAQLDQRFLLAPSHVKPAYLVHLLDKFAARSPRQLAMVFVRTCKDCQLLAIALRTLKINCLALHSMIPQKDRLAALARFKSQTCRILIATDVASRGLDIPSVQLVINYNVPQVPTDYVHRVGRTARAGRNGLSITIVTERDVKLVHAVEKVSGIKMKELADANDSESDDNNTWTMDEPAILKSLNEVELALREAQIRLDEVDWDEKRDGYAAKNKAFEMAKRKKSLRADDENEQDKSEPNKSRKRAK